MSFRARLLIALLVVVLVPLGVLALGVRNEMRVRILTQRDRRVQSLARVVEEDLVDTHESVGAAVAAIARALPDDAGFRAAALALVGGDRRYVIDYAANAMRAAGLTMLQIRNDSGRIVSSGHFPGEFDRVDSVLPSLLSAMSTPTFVALRTAEGSLISIARIDSTRIAGRRFTVVGGRTIDQRFLDRMGRGDMLGVVLELPDDTLRSRSSDRSAESPGNEQIVRAIPLPYIDATTAQPIRDGAGISITSSPVDADDLRRSVDRWILAAFLLATAAAVLAALALARRLSRPMEELAAAAGTVDLDRFDVSFATARDDEIGVLSRRLASMVDRLRGSATRLREAERRATVGDVARQVNHDIKNGLAPIRNVVRHLAQAARDEPSTLPDIFVARQGTIESSIEYLETLARNYAKLSPSLMTRPCDVRTVVDEVIRSAAGRGATIRARAAERLPAVMADAVVLRRILENLVGNAIDSLDGKSGEVTVGAESATDQRGLPMVRVTVSDTGRGMDDRELSRAFDDFYTTKPNGTGLGLSVVRRLVADLGGALRVETEPGRGTTISVDIPAAAATPTPTLSGAR